VGLSTLAFRRNVPRDRSGTLTRLDVGFALLAFEPIEMIRFVEGLNNKL